MKPRLQTKLKCLETSEELNQENLKDNTKQKFSIAVSNQLKLITIAIILTAKSIINSWKIKTTERTSHRIEIETLTFNPQISTATKIATNQQIWPKPVTNST